MIKGIFFGGLAACLILGMLLVAVMPDTLSRVYYRTVETGLQFSAAMPEKPLSLSGDMALPLIITNTASSDRIYRECAGPYLIELHVYREDQTEVPSKSMQAATARDSRDKDACRDVTIHAGQHSTQTITLRDMVSIDAPGDYYLRVEPAGRTQDDQTVNPKVAFRVTQ